MPERAQAVLRVEPHQIPALRTAFEDAADSVNQQVNDLMADGQIPEPWMGDPTSAKVKQIYDPCHPQHRPSSRSGRRGRRAR